MGVGVGVGVDEGRIVDVTVGEGVEVDDGINSGVKIGVSEGCFSKAGEVEVTLVLPLSLHPPMKTPITIKKKA